MSRARKAWVAINSWMNKHEVLIPTVITVGMAALSLAHALSADGRGWQVGLGFLSGFLACSAVFVLTQNFIHRRINQQVRELATLAGSTGYLKGMLEMHETMSGGDQR